MSTALSAALNTVAACLTEMGFTMCEIKVHTGTGSYRDLVSELQDTRDFDNVKVHHYYCWQEVSATARFKPKDECL